jgi:hypothetical protein
MLKNKLLATIWQLCCSHRTNFLHLSGPGLPDGFCQTKNTNLDTFWRSLDWNTYVYIFNGHLEYFTDIWDILWRFRSFCVHFVHFFLFLVPCTMKNLATLLCPSHSRKSSYLSFPSFCRVKAKQANAIKCTFLQCRDVFFISASKAATTNRDRRRLQIL